MDRGVRDHHSPISMICLSERNSWPIWTLGALGEDCSKHGPDRTARRVEAEVERAPRCPCRQGRERSGPTRVLYIRARQRPPRDQLARTVLDDLGVPLHGCAYGRLGPPVRPPVADRLHRLDVAHETGQVLKIVPEAVDLFGRTVDGDGPLHMDLSIPPTSLPRRQVPG